MCTWMAELVSMSQYEMSSASPDFSYISLQLDPNIRQQRAIKCNNSQQNARKCFMTFGSNTVVTDITFRNVILTSPQESLNLPENVLLCTQMWLRNYIGETDH